MRERARRNYSSGSGFKTWLSKSKKPKIGWPTRLLGSRCVAGYRALYRSLTNKKVCLHLLRLDGISHHDKWWIGSCLVVCDQCTFPNLEQEPDIEVLDLA